MYYNKKYQPVNIFLSEVHQAMITKYSNNVDEEKEKAKKLQDFFQNLKQASLIYNDPNAIIDNEVTRLILEGIIKHSPGNFKIENLFGRKEQQYAKNARESGARFERELTRVYQSVYESIAADPKFVFNKKQVNIGSLKSSFNLEDNLLLDEKFQKMLEELGTKTVKIIKDNNGNQHKAYYLQDVDGKIDVKGYSISIKANPKPELLEIYNLLSQARFTAKNYNSMSWDKKAQVFVETTERKTLTLGKTNIYRSILSVLQDLGYDNQTSMSAFWAGYNNIKKGDNDTSTHFYHLRYVYELIGAGIKYQNQSKGNANYLIYNDPSGNIYVKSTAEILADILNNNEKISTNSFMKKIVISKSKFD